MKYFRPKDRNLSEQNLNKAEVFEGAFNCNATEFKYHRCAKRGNHVALTKIVFI